jgi:hypothetical protein
MTQKLEMRLRGKHVLEMSKLGKTHRMALQARISPATAAKYINMAKGVKVFDLSVLLRMLMDGCGLSKDQILALPLGEVFEIVEADPEPEPEGQS